LGNIEASIFGRVWPGNPQSTAFIVEIQAGSLQNKWQIQMSDAGIAQIEHIFGLAERQTPVNRRDATAA
jgi:hypothetical protein